MKPNTLKIVAGISVLLFAQAVSRAQTTVRCGLEVNLFDTGLESTNIRSGAGKTFPVIGKLTARYTEVVYVVGIQGSWARISKIGDGESAEKTDGWVFASLLGMYVAGNSQDTLKKGDQQLYAEANRKSRALTRLSAGVFVTLAGCDGKWARIRFEGKTGWLAPEAQCTNMETACS